MTIVDCISDLHGFYPKLEGGDLLIVAGDLTARDTEEEFRHFYSWLNRQEYEDKILIAGNHDTFMVDRPDWWYEAIEDAGECTYLCDSGTEFEYEEEFYCNLCGNGKCQKTAICDEPVKKKLKIWGSPWSLTFPGMNLKCKAFTVDTEEELAEKWALIPDDIDILITHTPPHGCYLDQDLKGRMLGSTSLRDRLFKLNPKLHCFGHIHEGYGTHSNNVNASHVNERYEPVNKPIRVIL